MHAAREAFSPLSLKVVALRTSGRSTLDTPPSQGNEYRAIRYISGWFKEIYSPLNPSASMRNEISDEALGACGDGGRFIRDKYHMKRRNEDRLDSSPGGSFQGSPDGSGAGCTVTGVT